MPAKDFCELTMLTTLRLGYLILTLHYTVYQLCYVTNGSDYPFHSLCSFGQPTYYYK